MALTVYLAHPYDQTSPTYVERWRLCVSPMVSFLARVVTTVCLTIPLLREPWLDERWWFRSHPWLLFPTSLEWTVARSVLPMLMRDRETYSSGLTLLVNRLWLLQNAKVGMLRLQRGGALPSWLTSRSLVEPNTDWLWHQKRITP